MKYGFLNIKNRVMRMPQEDAGTGGGNAPAHADGEVDEASEPTFAELAGLPDMNVTLEYENPTNNGIALVTKAIMWNTIQDLNDPESGLTDEEIANINDILYNPGYAPMERLVRAFAHSFQSINPYDIPEEVKSNCVIDFANDWERLAFAIRPDMFAIISEQEIVEPLEPANPGHEGTDS